MALHASLVHYSLITIDVGNLWDTLARAFGGRDDALIGVDEYPQQLSALVQSSGTKTPLYVSVGTGDFLTPWLTRLYSEPATSLDKPTARIERLSVKHIELQAAARFEAAQVLEPNFVRKLELNLNTLKTDSDLVTHGVTLDTSTWQRLPLFHGYLFDDQFLIGPWRVGPSGYLHARTPLYKSSRRDLPNVYNFLQSVFSAPAT